MYGAGFGKCRPNLNSVEYGDEFEFIVFTFVKLGYKQGEVLCICKQALTDDIRFDNGFYMNNNYSSSPIRNEILTNFVPKLQGADLLPFDMELTAV